MKIHELKIEGMTCGHCVRAVEQVLTRVPGVHRAEVAIGTARVETDDGVPRDALVRAVEEEEYRVVG
ncbi:MAG: cation transporter [Sandaracinaceae bacterium]|nr:cation transporter [Sandaracinaceae bacterium]